MTWATPQRQQMSSPGSGGGHQEKQLIVNIEIIFSVEVSQGLCVIDMN